MTDKPQLLWRYMDFAKFIAVLEDRAIYCCPIRRFIDQYEGFIHDNFYDDLYTSMTPLVGGEDIAVFTARSAVATIMDSCFVSCWHLAGQEEPLMWANYVGKGHGVAIKTDTARLARAISGSTYTVRSGPVRYLPVEAERSSRDVPGGGEEHARWFFSDRFYQIPDLIDLLEEYRFVFRKETQYEFEREYRIVVVRDHGVNFAQWKGLIANVGFEYGTLGALDSLRLENEEELVRPRAIPQGIDFPVSLGELMIAVHAPPGSASWFVQLLRKILLRYNLPAVPIVESRA
jgi:hypothetical protein